MFDTVRVNLGVFECDRTGCDRMLAVWAGLVGPESMQGAGRSQGARRNLRACETARAASAATSEHISMHSEASRSNVCEMGLRCLTAWDRQLSGKQTGEPAGDGVLVGRCVCVHRSCEICRRLTLQESRFHTGCAGTALPILYYGRRTEVMHQGCDRARRT